MRAARAKFAALEFEQMDVLEPRAASRLKELGRPRSERAEPPEAGLPPSDDTLAPFALVCIDVNGNRPLDAVAAVLSVVTSALRPPLVLLKSRELWRHVATQRGTAE